MVVADANTDAIVDAQCERTLSVVDCDYVCDCIVAIHFYAAVYIMRQRTSKETVTDANTEKQCEWTLAQLPVVVQLQPSVSICKFKLIFLQILWDFKQN